MTEKTYRQLQLISAVIAIAGMAVSFAGLNNLSDLGRVAFPGVAILGLLGAVALELRKRESRLIFTDQMREWAYWRTGAETIATLTICFSCMGIAKFIGTQMGFAGNGIILLSLLGAFGGVMVAEIAIRFLALWK